MRIFLMKCSLGWVEWFCINIKLKYVQTFSFKSSHSLSIVLIFGVYGLEFSINLSLMMITFLTLWLPMTMTVTPGLPYWFFRVWSLCKDLDCKQDCLKVIPAFPVGQMAPKMGLELWLGKLKDWSTWRFVETFTCFPSGTNGAWTVVR